MAAIGPSWAADAWVEASWVTGAWGEFVESVIAAVKGMISNVSSMMNH